MRDVAGFNLNCTSNDVRVAGVATNPDGTPKLTILDDGCRFPGDTVDFTATFDVLLTAQARYDIGIYFALDGDPNQDGALTGSCSITSLDANNTPGFVNLDAAPDSCGDIDAAHNPLQPTITLLNVACVDRNNDRQLDFPNCISWRQPGSNELCTQPTDAFPGAPSKCKCDTGFSVPIDVPPATIVVTKTANKASVDEPGDAVTYTVSVQNSGIDPANPFTLQSLIDDKFGNLNGKGTCSVPQTIAASGTYTCSFTATVSGNAGQVHTNIVEGKGVDSRGNPASDTDDQTVNILGSAPSILVTKTANPTQVLEPGANVGYTVTVRNTSVSSDPVTINSLSDDKFGNLNGKGTCSVSQTIQPGSTYSCTFTAPVNGNAGYVHTNTVTASGVDDDGASVTGSDSATVNVLNAPSSITVTKTPTPVSLPEPGGTASYAVVVRNNSTVDTVVISSLVDDKFGNLNGQGTCTVPRTILPGATYSCSFSAALQGNAGQSHVNTVTASGLDDDNDPVSDSDSATVNFSDVLPAATLSKTAKSVIATYEIKVTNDKLAEDVFLTTLTDDKFGNLTTVHGAIQRTTCRVPQTLAPMGQAGDSYTCTFDAVVTTSPHTNRASGQVSDDEANEVSPTPSDTATVSFE
jgi:uncharacterized repeat protein (TIGR01451 family)